MKPHTLRYSEICIWRELLVFASKQWENVHLSSSYNWFCRLAQRKKHPFSQVQIQKTQTESLLVGQESFAFKVSASARSCKAFDCNSTCSHSSWKHVLLKATPISFWTFWIHKAWGPSMMFYALTRIQRNIGSTSPQVAGVLRSKFFVRPVRQRPSYVSWIWQVDLHLGWSWISVEIC